MCTVSLYFSLFVLKRGHFSAALWERRKTTYPRLIAINIVRGCNISPMGGILFPDTTKSGFERWIAPHQSTNQTSAASKLTCPTVEPLHVLPMIAYNTGFDKRKTSSRHLAGGFLYCLAGFSRSRMYAVRAQFFSHTRIGCNSLF